MHLDFVRTMTMKFGKGATDPAIGTPGRARAYWNVVLILCPQASLIEAITDKAEQNIELAYTYRYVINNGRTEGPQWSIRQTAVLSENGREKWLLYVDLDSA